MLYADGSTIVSICMDLTQFNNTAMLNAKILQSILLLRGIRKHGTTSHINKNIIVKKYYFKEQQKHVKKIGLHKRHCMILAYSDYVASMYPGKRGNMQKTDKFQSIKYGFQFVFADTDFSWKCLLQLRIASLPTVYFTVIPVSFGVVFLIVQLTNSQFFMQMIFLHSSLTFLYTKIQYQTKFWHHSFTANSSRASNKNMDCFTQ